MPIDNQEKWNLQVQKAGSDNPCIIVAKQVMKLLDTCKNFTCDEIIAQAIQNTSIKNFTKYHDRAVTFLIFNCHSRGEEFQNQWNMRYNNATYVSRIVNKRRC